MGRYMEKDTVIDSAAQRAVGSKEIQKIIEEAAAQALKNLDPKALANKIEMKVNGAWENMVLKMLGFDKHWGEEWEIDHCNGRHSAMSSLIQEKAKKATDEFLQRCGEALPKIQLDDELLAAIKEDYDEVFKRYLHESVARLAKINVENMVNNKLSKLLDQYVDPEAEAINALHQAIKSVKDPNVVEVLKKSLSELELYTYKSLEEQ
jgi:hypothetical protein